MEHGSQIDALCIIYCYAISNFLAMAIGAKSRYTMLNYATWRVASLLGVYWILELVSI
jgi:hypothetical protein